MTRTKPTGGDRSTRVWRTLCALATVLLAGLTLSNCAQASTDEAWDTFRADVKNRCESAARDQLDDIKIMVDPFGSAHYGLALLNGTEHGASVRRSLICVYDKQAKTVELGTPFDPAAAIPAE